MCICIYVAYWAISVLALQVGMLPEFGWVGSGTCRRCSGEAALKVRYDNGTIPTVFDDV